ncbi:hypothetical protein M1545_02655, partial [Patescibacteria group bacterium]|nr:hypothetical protein [Patescibacteria group bacterium]
DEKNEVTGIIWAKQETFKDSKGNVGYLGDSTIATKGAGWFGMEQMGYWTKDKKLIATVDPKTGEAKEIIPIPEFKGLKLEGFTQKYDPEKKVWTYLDTDGKKIAYWNEKGNEGKGRVELIEGIKEIDFKKHQALFTGWAAKEAESAILKAAGEGEIKLPIPFLPNEGQVLERASLKKYLAFRNLKTNTVIFASFGGMVSKVASGNGKGRIDAYYIKLSSPDKLISVNIYYPTKDQYLGPSYGGVVNLETPLVNISETTFPSAFGDSDCQTIMASSLREKATDISFANFLRTNEGRLVYIK